MHFVRWNLTSVTQPLHTLSNALELAIALKIANSSMRPSIERVDGLPLDAAEQAAVDKAGL